LEFSLCTLTPEVQYLTFHQNQVVWQTKIKSFWWNGNDSKQPYWICINRHWSMLKYRRLILIELTERFSKLCIRQVFLSAIFWITAFATMICWRCHSNSINTRSPLPNISDVKTWKRRNMIGIDMIRNNRIAFSFQVLMKTICLFYWY
jgi:hypothetical protein